MKGVAVPYIIAILLGVGVIGLVGYWLFISGGQFGAGAATQQCRTDFQQACNEWAGTGYSGNKPAYSGVFTSGSDCEKALVKDKNTNDALDKDEYKSACA